MAVGFGIFLIVVGAILAFATSFDVQGVNVEMVGFIMMGVGALAIVVSLITNQQRTHTEHRQVVDRHESGPAPDVRRDDRGY
ncbi:DUF6458 family protein [Ornithinimicrobium sediminis]|uniref:DUF6458 family protein n=1 Tax=Ornithinimicrobium sediminis TaxID=2904603 RepID=UPI001E4C46F4|nr:DUF6458 family protein [Ornithinimicrobium sediminis]MCE0486746.1 DUF6458 family protein [Ornithinimicrobium sediminis]